MHNLSTGGLEEFDYWLTDGSLHPEDTKEYASERLMRLPSLYLHHPPHDAPESAVTRSTAADQIVFGSFSNPSKLNDEVLAAWAEILKRVPRARLRLGYRDDFADPWLKSRVGRILTGAGIDAHRVEYLRERPDARSHLLRVAGLDVALDPFPFAGGTSTFESLWMGVPVVTLAGRRFAGRCGVSLLHQVGLDDFVAATVADYVRIAVDLAMDQALRATLRGSLRRRVATSRLCNPTAYARSVETAYRAMWHAWIDRRRRSTPEPGSGDCLG
jgi:predicted O-linked N-acetylglucosamine transferase (SPINDLY family)